MHETDAELELIEGAAFAGLADAAGLPLTVPGAVCVANPTLPQVTMLNRVTGLGLTGPVGDAELTRSTPSSARRACVRDPGEPVRAGGARRAPSGTWLRAGLRVGEVPARRGGSRARADRAPSRDRTDVPLFGRVVATAYQMPAAGAAWFASLPGREGWHCFVAFDGDEPAGVWALFVRGSMGWLGSPD